ncbi:bifunctional 3,4-dihydroxy-2-butanone-4-phosphate synthase/GTP cyclohydrolase II [Lysinibacillus louembei]|uniref:Riboflavin biosynthesis protein RibBA n=1 Tax=Lysinibacillus louembei TaxID=1470088 RepID=A0ABZ0S0X0_9BACI|nr:bifunctional 3,4-dihydroxy-2-butanone-4-phosphate synthase/GTP cyclohydrolase II [Lysinibacillus louembei]WPK10922.1 bifunctional 3,4-dihydroxy-2-butanone-4-phosphate synthase/GTP cyclohydrolase II [Lysinibacillus louembei]
MFNTIEEAIADLKQGKIVIVVDDENRENEGDFVVLAEYVTPEVINFMATYGKGLICTPISSQIAHSLSLEPMVQFNTDNHQTAFTVSIDYMDTTTGISAFQRALTIEKMLDDNVQPQHFRRPGHVFPLIAKENGVLVRPGHTEATVDLAMLCGSKQAGVICEIMNEDGTMARLPQLKEIAEKFNMKLITIESLIRYRLEKEKVVSREAKIQLPTHYGEFIMIGYTNFIDSKEHVAIVKGNLQQAEAPLIRIHSECLTGDIFSSKRCDCGAQLQAALAKIEQEGEGAILYMRQEGRGIGLLNKLKAYELQEQGYDTVEANEMLGFPSELRDYSLCAQMLRDLGVTHIRLMTNNPDKVAQLERYDITVVERVPLVAGLVEENTHYMNTKKEKMAHLL